MLVSNFWKFVVISAILIAAMKTMPVAVAGPLPDEKGVMMYSYGGSVGTVYNPKVVATEGLRYHADYVESGYTDLDARGRFLNSADWLVDNAVSKGNYSLWEYGFEWQSYGGVEPPYSSALAQSQGIHVLIKAHNMTKDARYLDAATKAFNAFLTDYEDGGVVSAENNGTKFLQILAKAGFQKTYVLNGHTASLLHLWKYYQYTHDERAGVIFYQGVEWLKENLSKYDTGSWSYYDQMGTEARDNYHLGHTRQLYFLYQVTGEPVLKEYADRFDGYNGSQYAGDMPVWNW